MEKVLNALRRFLARLAERECPPDTLSRMSPLELADLPAIHPARDTDPCGCGAG